MFVFMSFVVNVWGSVGSLLLKIVIFSSWSVEICCAFCLYCEAWSCRCSCMGSVSVSSCRCCMFVSCVYPVSMLHSA